MNLDHGSASIAAGSGEAREALAKTGIVIALSTATALVAVVVRRPNLSGVLLANGEVEAVDLGRAAITALVVLNDEQVLFSLHVFTNEGNVDHESNLVPSAAVDLNIVDHSVGQLEEGVLNGEDKLVGVSVFRLENNRSGAESLVQLGLEGQGESVAVEFVDVVLVDEPQALHLVLERLGAVNSSVHHIVTIGAEALGAVHIAVFGVTHAGAGFLVVPLVEGEGLHVLHELATLVSVEGAVGIAEGLDVLAGAVAGAVVGAGGSLAALALVALEALALAGLSVADAFVGTLGVLVEVSQAIGGVHPGKLKGADAVGAIPGIEIIAHTPIVIAEAEAALADTVATAAVVARSRSEVRKCGKGKCKDSFNHSSKAKKQNITVQDLLTCVYFIVQRPHYVANNRFTSV